MQAPTDLLAWMLARATEDELLYAFLLLATERNREPFERLESLVARARIASDDHDDREARKRRRRETAP